MAILGKDKTPFERAKDAAQYMVDETHGRDQIDEAMERMYFITPEDEGDIEDIQQNTKVTLSPDPANSLIGAVQLLTAEHPIFSVPHGEGISEEISNTLEKCARAWWNAAGKIARVPITHDMALTGLLYDRAHVAVISTKEMVNLAARRGERYRKRAERNMRLTPFLYRVMNPRECYYREAGYGLETHLRVIETKAYQVRADWGNLAEEALRDVKDDQTITHKEYWDLENHFVWLEDRDEPILKETNDLPFIPIGVITAKGSPTIYSKADEAIRPFLYEVYKSNLWSNLNYALSVMYTQILGIGSNPQFVYKAMAEGKDPDIDWSVPGGIITILQNEEFGPLAKITVDPSLLAGVEYADEKIEQSTLYRQVLGEPIGSQVAYSTHLLLHHSGKTSLVSPQERLSWLCAELMEMSFEWLRIEGGERKVRLQKEYLKINPRDIPADVQVDAELTIDLPLDEVEMGGLAARLNEAGLVSKEWGRKNYLQIEQSAEMTDQIFGEMFAEMKAREYVTGEMRKEIEAELRAEYELAMQQMVQQGQPVQGQPVQEVPGGY